MSDVTILVRPDGPLVVTGNVRIVDVDGREFQPPIDVVKLCRCGLSATMPFCDGAHSAGGFRPGTRADAG